MNITIFFLTLSSALFLGGYDFLKKISLKGNSTLFVLWVANLTGFLLVLPFAAMMGQFHVDDFFERSQLYILGKAVLVNTSWNLAYLGLKNLPLSLASPLRASAPLWVFAGGILFFNEAPNPSQWVGVFLIVLSYIGFTKAGLKEGILFFKNPWILAMVGATLLGASSALFDKHLLSTLKIPYITLQVWFSFYLVLIQSILLYIGRKKSVSTNFRWTIPLVGAVLVISDLLYFKAVQVEGSYISLISPLRRSGVLVSFVLAFMFLKEKNFKQKLWPMLGILLGIILLGWFGR